MRPYHYIALALGGMWVALALFAGDAQSIFITTVWVLLSFSLIFGSEVWGSYTGRVNLGGSGSRINHPSPPGLIRAFGFLFLLAPLALLIFSI